MPKPRDEPNPEPAGFGKCENCAYLESGTPAICFACARRAIEPTPPDCCTVCGHEPEIFGSCGNPICNWQFPEKRKFERVHIVAMRTGILEKSINRYKFVHKKGWAIIFGRVIAGFLAENSGLFEPFDLITSSPTFVGMGPGVRNWDHTGLVLQEVDKASEQRWPIDRVTPKAVTKIVATPRLTGKNWKERRKIAETALRSALIVPDPARTAGRAILVYDDIFTEGFTLNEVARCLLDIGGARKVEGIYLARQKFTPRPGPFQDETVSE